MSQTSTLYQLQTLDSQRDVLLKRLGEITALLNQNEEVRRAQRALEEADQSTRHFQGRQKELELERDQLQSEAKSSEERLYSGQIFNPRELTDLQDKIAELNRRREALETPILEAMVGLEDSTSLQAACRETLERVLAEQAVALGALTTEQTGLQAKVAALEPEISETRQLLASSSIALYDRLRQRPGGIAVTLLKGDECGVCGVELTTQVTQQIKRGEVNPCPTCGRILYAG